MVERLLDLGLERLDDRGGRGLVAVVQVAGADDRLGDGGQHALGLDERRRGVADAVGRVLLQAAGTSSRSATARHEVPETVCARIFVRRPAP